MAPDGKKFSFERELFPKVLEKGHKVYGFVSNDYWLDVGTPEKYLMAHHDIALGKIKYQYPYPELKDEIYIGKGVKYTSDNFQSGPLLVGDGTVIEEGAIVAPLSVVGNNCRICSGARVSGAVIFDNCTIGKNCYITDSIISHNVKLGEDVHISGLSVIGDNTVIQKENILDKGIRIDINSAIEEGQIKF
jgi:NDP-sugar pyrophosphorylase family protein